jgi:hypothetical protein
MQLRAGVLGTGMLRPRTKGTTDRGEIFHCVLVEGRSVCAFDEIVLMLLRSQRVGQVATWCLMSPALPAYCAPTHAATRYPRYY